MVDRIRLLYTGWSSPGDLSKEGYCSGVSQLMFASQDTLTN